MMNSIQNYLNFGSPLGGFLHAVFSNDLTKACSRADEYNLKILPTYVIYIYNMCPMSSNGSEKAILEWMKAKQVESMSSF